MRNGRKFVLGTMGRVVRSAVWTRAERNMSVKEDVGSESVRLPAGGAVGLSPCLRSLNGIPRHAGPIAYSLSAVNPSKIRILIVYMKCKSSEG